MWWGEDGEPNKWLIRIPDEDPVTVWESTDNYDKLDSFRTAVEDVNDAEGEVIVAVGGTAGIAALTAFLSGGTAAALAIAGGGIAMQNAFDMLDRASRDAEYYYYRIV